MDCRLLRKVKQHGMQPYQNHNNLIESLIEISSSLQLNLRCVILSK